MAGQGRPVLGPGRPQAVYFNHDMLAELEREAFRLDRPIAWLIRRAWGLAKDEIAKLPAPPAVDSDDEEDEVAA